MLALLSRVPLTATALAANGLHTTKRPPALISRAIESKDGKQLEALAVPATWDAHATLETNINSSEFIPFLRAVIVAAEEDLGLKNYHLRLCVHPTDDVPRRGHKVRLTELKGRLLEAAERAGCFVVLVGDRLPVREVPRAPALEVRDRPIEYTDDSGKQVTLAVCQEDLLVSEGDHCAVFLDAQARSMYVSVLKHRFERRQSALSDAELSELWRLPMAECFKKHARGFVDARINAGSAQNVAHVHLKVWLREDEFVERWGGNSAFRELRRASTQRKAARAQQSITPRS